MTMPAPTTPWTAVIPLRGGSKGLPGKNTRPLAGKPLYQHAVDAALAAGAIRVLISTDIQAVLDTTHSPCVHLIKRPASLCEDNVPMAPVLSHALETAQVSGPVVLLQATSPLRTPHDILEALSLLTSHDHELVMSVTEADRGVLKWGRVEAGRFMPLSHPEHCFSNRQSLPPVFRPNGAVYAMHAEWFLSRSSFVSERIAVVVMPPERSHDIDSLADFERCEALHAIFPSQSETTS
jgi:CMP-N-acetylneuraminic acid synthetase